MTLAAVLACRNQSARLYAKPLQNLAVDRAITILDHLVGQLRLRPEIDAIVLAISENEENLIYVRVAERLGLPHVRGDDDDVLGRLLAGADLVGADQLFRVTTESPYPHLDDLAGSLVAHVNEGADYSSTLGLPDGAFYELVSVAALRRSWDEGGSAYRNELCTRFIFDHQDEFAVVRQEAPAGLCRDDIRLTVDWPEDLIVMRRIYEDLCLSPDSPHSVPAIIEYLDAHPKLNAVNNWIDSGIGRIWY